MVKQMKALLFVWFLIVIIAVPVTNGVAATAKEIDVSVDVVLERFQKQVKGAAEFAQGAKGLLVFANVKKAGLVVGGEYGEGALRVKGKTAGYYNVASASFGLQIGVQSKDMIIAFMTDEALKQFQESKGWQIGVDGNVALINIGAGGAINTKTIKDPIVAFVFDVKGLMADVSLSGSKITKLNR